MPPCGGQAASQVTARCSQYRHAHRKLASLVLDASQARSGASGAAEANGGAPHAAPRDAAELDLTGEREFLVAETAQDALASMLATGATVSRVSISRLD